MAPANQYFTDSLLAVIGWVRKTGTGSVTSFSFIRVVRISGVAMVRGLVRISLDIGEHKQHEEDEVRKVQISIERARHRAVLNDESTPNALL